MLEVLVEAALRSLVLAAAVWFVLRLPGLRNRQIQLTAWTIVLGASLLMPVATRVAAVVMPPGAVALPDIGQFRLLNSGMLPGQGTAEAPGWTGATGTASAVANPAVVSESRSRDSAASRWPNWRSLALLCYATVCGALLIRLLAGLLLAARIVRAATPLHETWTSGHDIRISGAVGAPATFGSVILLPRDHAAWPQIKRMAVVAHEAAHVRRRDFHVQVAASLNRAIFWFSPLSWWLRRELSVLAEAASDDAAVLDMCDRPTYAAILLEVADRSRSLPAGVAMARPATVRARVERILAETAAPAFITPRNRKMLLGGLVLLVTIAAGPLTVSAPTPVANEAEQQTPYQRIEIDPKLLDADVGFYQDKASGSVMIVSREGDHLMTGRMGNVRYAEYPYTQHDFFLTAQPHQNHFVTDSSGTVIRVVHRANGLVTIFDRISPETAQQLQANYDRELMPHTPVKLAPEALQNFVGYYQLTPTLIVSITREGDQLFAQATLGRRHLVFPFGERDFFYTTCAAQITFLKPSDGPATALIFHEEGLDRTAPRVGADVVAQLQQRLDNERKPHTPASIDGELLDLYVGRYGAPGSTMKIVRDGDHLIAQATGFDKYVVYPYTDHDFFATKAPSQISFVTNAQGRVVQLVRHQNGEDVVFRKFDRAECSAEAGTAQCS